MCVIQTYNDNCRVISVIFLDTAIAVSLFTSTFLPQTNVCTHPWVCGCKNQSINNSKRNHKVLFYVQQLFLASVHI